jgi:hypothetical protein
LLGGNNFFLSLVGKKRKKKERKIPLSFSLSLNIRVVVFAPVALSLEEMMIFSSHSERTNDEENREI